MKSLKWLWMSILAEAGMRCDTDTQLDIKKMSSRIEHEGISFLTIALPAFCSDFESCLGRGLVDSNDFLGFRRSSGLPAFLRGFLSQVFDPVSGRLLGYPSTEAILCVRQICLMWKKVKIPCSNHRTRRSIDAYIQAEVDLSGPLLPDQIAPIGAFRNLAGIIWSECLGRLHGCVSDHQELLPRHGPGAVQERGLRGNRKFRSWVSPLLDGSSEGNTGIVSRRRSHLASDTLIPWHARLQPFFPYDAFCVASLNNILLSGSAVIDGPIDRDPDAESPVRVITVPKTQKTPRIIAIEPLCMQYAQQALMETMVDTIASSSISRGHVNFRNQRVNQRLAQNASRHGNYATIDLSEASDRVSLSLVEHMFSSAPLVLEAVLACRSTRAELPDGRIISLQKFASMGSALCFPVESMVFFTIAILAGLQSANLPHTVRNVKNVARRVYVYGDDIIVPTRQVVATIALLESFRMKVNTRKSHWTGKFRESCGMDAYDGVNVTPVYVRSLPPCRRHNVPELVSFVSLANQLYLKGWWSTARLVRECCESILGSLPHVLETSPCLGWVSVSNTYSIHRWGGDLQRPEVKAYVVSSAMYSDPLNEDGALMKHFLRRGEEPSFEGSLERSVRPDSVRIKRRWASPY